jgi:hypothetical protein
MSVVTEILINAHVYYSRVYTDVGAESHIQRDAVQLSCGKQNHNFGFEW